MNKTISFDKYDIGPYSVEQINKEWNAPKRITGAKDGRANIVNDPLDPSRKVLEIKYPQGKIGQEEDGGGGQWRLRFEESFNKCAVEYQVMFPVGFDFVNGGKKSDGSDGFSARIMWREQGEIFQYMYWMERAPEKNWGDNLPWTDVNGDQKPFRFVPGQWHTLKTDITMNTHGERDGTIVSWLDGKLALSRTGAFRAKGATFGIDNLNFTTFFGGNAPDWAPTKDEVAYFADFKITG